MGDDDSKKSNTTTWTHKSTVETKKEAMQRDTDISAHLAAIQSALSMLCNSTAPQAPFQTSLLVSALALSPLMPVIEDILRSTVFAHLDDNIRRVSATIDLIELYLACPSLHPLLHKLQRQS